MFEGFVSFEFDRAARGGFEATFYFAIIRRLETRGANDGRGCIENLAAANKSSGTGKSFWHFQYVAGILG